jgi:hypothetical protein
VYGSKHLLFCSMYLITTQGESGFAVAVLWANRGQASLQEAPFIKFACTSAAVG